MRRTSGHSIRIEGTPVETRIYNEMIAKLDSLEAKLEVGQIVYFKIDSENGTTTISGQELRSRNADTFESWMTDGARTWTAKVAE